MSPTGGEKVELVRLERVRASTLVALVVGVLALVVLLPQVTTLSGAARAMADADWPWLVPVVACAGLQYVASSVTFRAATPLRPPFGLATNIRFLQRSGYDATGAATVMALVSLTGGVAGAVLIAVSFTWAGQSGAPFPWPGDAVLLVAAAAVLGLAGLVVLVPALRRFAGDRLAPVARQVRTAVGEPGADPRRAVTMLAGSLANSLLRLVGLWFVLHAFGATIGIAVMGAVLFGGKALAGAAPTPGGVGAVEAALIGGLSGAGVDPAVATPAVLVFRLIVNRAVVIPGWWALHVLRARHAL